MASSCGSGTGSVTRLDTSKFTEAYQKLVEANKNFSAAKENIHRQTEKLKDSWAGKGADKFDISYWRLKQELDDEEETLIALADSLQEMYNSYREWDTSTAGSISGSTSESAQPTFTGPAIGAAGILESVPSSADFTREEV